jgi:hypothetical protein
MKAFLSAISYGTTSLEVQTARKPKDVSTIEIKSRIKQETLSQDLIIERASEAEGVKVINQYYSSSVIETILDSQITDNRSHRSLQMCDRQTQNSS